MSIGSGYSGPGLYLHYKGGRYEVLGLGLQEADHLPVVVYRPEAGEMPADVHPSDFWTRPLDSFNGEVIVGGLEDWSREVVPRFVRIA